MRLGQQLGARQVLALRLLAVEKVVVAGQPRVPEVAARAGPLALALVLVLARRPALVLVPARRLARVPAA